MTAHNPSDATIFYTTDGSTPTHNGSSPSGSTHVYNSSLLSPTCADTTYKAIEYKTGYIDSDVTVYLSKHGNDSGCGGGGGFAPMSPSAPTIIYIVWDGDWAILEEYDQGGGLVERYLQGYHGLVKTFVQNVYYYQDELGSTSHIADGTGSLVESYQYDVYGSINFGLTSAVT